MFTSAADVQTFLFAGHAILTLQSEATGRHFTYRVTVTENNPNRFFVSFLSSPETYSYMGLIDQGAFRTTAKSKVTADADVLRAFVYFLRHLTEGKRIAPSLIVRHEGGCGRCGRPLTHPDSIDRGIGPECAKRLECV